MSSGAKVFVSASALRRQLSSLNLQRGKAHAHEVTYGRSSSVIYGETEAGEHGNFLTASYKRICADPQWKSRLDKTYTGVAWVARSWERQRGELECANSSDALLMNVFCYPRLLHSSKVCALLGIEPGTRPEFGVRALVPMHREEVDRTELDMCIGKLQVEAKLTESSFGTASRQRLYRYLAVDEVFDVEDLPWQAGKVAGYQLIRGVLAAHAAEGRYILICDDRRADLMETWFRVLRAVRSCDVRSRMGLLTWQEVARVSPSILRTFLRDKYGIEAAA